MTRRPIRGRFGMKSSNAVEEIKYLHINFSGSGYTAALDTLVEEGFREDNVEAIVHGEQAPAAGPELWMDVAIGVGSNFAVEAIQYVARKVRNAIAMSSTHGCCVTETIVEDSDCDFVIRANSAAGIMYEDIDLTNLVSKMRELVDSEKTAGRFISKIETPCDLNPVSQGLSVRSVGVGNYSLWLLTYREGERCPYWLYDAANKTFTPLENSRAVKNALDSSDLFYSAK